MYLFYHVLSPYSLVSVETLNLFFLVKKFTSIIVLFLTNFFLHSVLRVFPFFFHFWESFSLTNYHIIERSNWRRKNAHLTNLIILLITLWFWRLRQFSLSNCIWAFNYFGKGLISSFLIYRLIWLVLFIIEWKFDFVFFLLLFNRDIGFWLQSKLFIWFFVLLPRFSCLSVSLMAGFIGPIMRPYVFHLVVCWSI